MDTQQEHLLHVPNRRLGEHLWASAASLSLTGALGLVEQHSRLDKRYSALVFVRYSQVAHPLDAVLAAAQRYCSATCVQSESTPGAGVLRLSGDDLQATYVAVVPGHLADVWLVITDASRSSREFRKLIRPALRITSRKIPNAWLTTRQFKEVVMGAAERASLPLTPTRVSSVQRDGSTIRFPRETTGRQLFERLDHDEAVLRSMDFMVGTRLRPALRAALDRSCLLQYRAGVMHVFEQSLLTRLEAHTQKHFRTLSISHDDAMQGREIGFKFRRGVMEDTSANRRLIDTLGRLKRASVNVYHANPYLHVAVTDFWDGSTMDLYAHSPDELTIIPGLDCSGKAVSRVFDHVYDCFAAGEISDIPDIAVPARSTSEDDAHA